MKKIMMTVVSAVIAAGCVSTCDLSMSDTGDSKMREAITPSVEAGELPGAISILYDNGVQDVVCVGYADVAAKRPITVDDTFMQCSQTKGFCGVTVAKLIEEGKLSLDDPISKYLPEFAKPGYTITPRNKEGKMFCVETKTPITIRMCLNHSAGFPFELPNAQNMGGWSRRMPLRSVAATAASQRLLFEPGHGVAYSNVGIDVAAAVVEVVTGKKWEEYLKENVLDPLGMKDTTFWPTEAKLKTKIELYSCEEGRAAKHLKDHAWMRRPYNDSGVFSSAGAGLWTTARDQLKFYKMLMNLGMGDNGVRILKEETVKNLLACDSRGNVKSKHKQGGYSLGLAAPVSDNENAWFGHGGAWGTQCMVNWHKRQLKLWVVQRTGPAMKKLEKATASAASEFFKAKKESSDGSAYTGRLK